MPKKSVAPKNSVAPRRSVVPKKSLAPKKSVAVPRKTMLMKANEMMKAELPTICPDKPWTVTKKPTLPVDSLPDLDGYARMSRLLSYDRLDKTMGVVLHKVFGQLLEKKLTDFQAAKKRIKNALNKDFGDSKKLGTPQRLKPMAALQEQIRHYKRMEIEFDEDETVDLTTTKTTKSAKKSTAGSKKGVEEKRVTSGKKSLAKKKSTICISQSEESEEFTDVSDEESEEDEESDEYEDDIADDVRSEALRRATACPRMLKEASLTKSNIRVPRKSTMHTISSKMKTLALDETNDYDASIMEETQMTIEQSHDEGEMHETMVTMDEDDEDYSEGEEDDEEADVQMSEDSPSFIRQATPYPKSAKPMSTSSSFKGTPHPSSRVEKPSSVKGSVKSIRSVVSNKISGAKSSRSRAGSKASYRSGGAESLINYDLADLSSADETDNEECPKKPVPRWAQNSQVGPITVVLRSMLSDEQRERYFGRIELPTRDALFTYKDKARKKTLKEAPLDWYSPLSNPRSANSRYLQMLEEVKARNAGATSFKRDK